MVLMLCLISIYITSYRWDSALIWVVWPQFCDQFHLSALVGCVLELPIFDQYLLTIYLIFCARYGMLCCGVGLKLNMSYGVKNVDTWWEYWVVVVIYGYLYGLVHCTGPYIKVSYGMIKFNCWYLTVSLLDNLRIIVYKLLRCVRIVR